MTGPSLLAPSFDVPHARLKLDALNLLLPQTQVHSVEAAVDVKPLPGGVGAIGQIQAAGTRWRVWNLDHHLKPVMTPSLERRACALFVSGRVHFGILCDELQSVDAETAQALPLPACMRTSSTPLTGLALFADGKVGCISHAQGLATVIGLISGTSDGAPQELTQDGHDG